MRTRSRQSLQALVVVVATKAARPTSSSPPRPPASPTSVSLTAVVPRCATSPFTLPTTPDFPSFPQKHVLDRRPVLQHQHRLATWQQSTPPTPTPTPLSPLSSTVAPPLPTPLLPARRILHHQPNHHHRKTPSCSPCSTLPGWVRRTPSPTTLCCPLAVCPAPSLRLWDKRLTVETM